MPLPPHLYGELAKTNEGCELLQKHNVIPERIECLGGSSIANQVNALWALVCLPLLGAERSDKGSLLFRAKLDAPTAGSQSCLKTWCLE